MNSVQIQEAINQACAERDQEIERLKAKLQSAGVSENEAYEAMEEQLKQELIDKTKYISTLEALLEQVPHHTKQMGYFMNPDIYKFICFDDCPRCAYEKLKGAQ